MSAIRGMLFFWGPSDHCYDSSSNLFEGDRRHRQYHPNLVEPLGESHMHTSRSRDDQMLRANTARTSARAEDVASAFEDSYEATKMFRILR
ncbi:hypothetical protein PoB_004044200 [Plakobranchus ocellatus]|uniref:Uncharacterized protein n=1 Tax=Plakobranchus ocellatus TaxID=259542 RepID=A0AAV4B474_9GAST|nr:hypothetical protein PoB_004044200 [Plakobranchus ocellatus]